MQGLSEQRMVFFSFFLHQSEANGEDLSPVHIGQESETLKYHEVAVRF